MIKPLNAEELIQEIKFSSYISKKVELENIEGKCKKVLEIQEQHDAVAAEHINEALEFVKAIWEKYDCAEIADIYIKFVKIEEALFGLERDEKDGSRYREHFVHMFNCYVFGLRIFSKLFSVLDDDQAKKAFKIDSENLKAVGLPFGSDYSYKQRLWLHDDFLFTCGAA